MLPLTLLSLVLGLGLLEFRVFGLCERKEIVERLFTDYSISSTPHDTPQRLTLGRLLQLLFNLQHPHPDSRRRTSIIRAIPLILIPAIASRLCLGLTLLGRLVPPDSGLIRQPPGSGVGMTRLTASVPLVLVCVLTRGLLVFELEGPGEFGVEVDLLLLVS